MNEINNYEYCILNSCDEETILGAAECLAETFAGIKVGDAVISEPMVSVCNLSKEDFIEFVKGYIKNVVDQKLCIVAKDKKTGKVVGALACEDFNVEDEVPVFDGGLEPMNKIMPLLVDLDVKFVETVESKTGQKIQLGDYVHGFMIGVRLEKDKKYVAREMMNLLISESKKRGFKGMFVEATNIRSQKLITKLFDFYIPKDLENDPIVKKYKEDDFFNSIPEHISEECALMYMHLKEEYHLL